MYKGREKIEQEIGFRSIDCPCCGNCRHFRIVDCPACWRVDINVLWGPRICLPLPVQGNNLCDRFESKEREGAQDDPPCTAEQVLADIRARKTPPDDPYGAPEVGLLLSNAGWTAVYDDANTDTLLDKTYQTGYDAAVALWEFLFRGTNKH